MKARVDQDTMLVVSAAIAGFVRQFVRTSDLGRRAGAKPAKAPARLYPTPVFGSPGMGSSPVLTTPLGSISSSSVSLSA
jgi:hypothetical protein